MPATACAGCGQSHLLRRSSIASLVGHLEEEQVGDLLDVVAVVDAVVAQGVAEAPEFLDDVGHAAIASLRSLNEVVELAVESVDSLDAQPPAREDRDDLEVLPVDRQVLRPGARGCGRATSVARR